MSIADPLRKAMTDEAFWAQPIDALPPWMIAERSYIVSLNIRLGPGGTMRLVELIGEAGGLAPPEAKPWFEVEHHTWARIERILDSILQNRRDAGCTMPRHLLRWVEGREPRCTPLLDADGNVT